MIYAGERDVHGTEYHTCQVNTDLINGSLTPILIYEETFPYTGGVYNFVTSLVVTASSANTQYAAFVELDAVNPFGLVVDVPITKAGGVQTQNDSFPLPLAPGLHTFSYYAYQSGGPGTLSLVVFGTQQYRLI